LGNIALAASSRSAHQQGNREGHFPSEEAGPCNGGKFIETPNLTSQFPHRNTPPILSCQRSRAMGRGRGVMRVEETKISTHAWCCRAVASYRPSYPTVFRPIQSDRLDQQSPSHPILMMSPLPSSCKVNGNMQSPLFYPRSTHLARGLAYRTYSVLHHPCRVGPIIACSSFQTRSSYNVTEVGLYPNRPSL